MAFPLQRGITPPEIEFLSEMEMVTVVPRQRLEELELLSVSEICTPQSIYFPPPLPECEGILRSTFFTRELISVLSKGRSPVPIEN